MTAEWESGSHTVRALVDDLADFLGRSVVVNDPQVRALYSSRHFQDEDPVRVRAILQHEVGPDVVAYVLSRGVAHWTRAGWVPEQPELQLSRRLCVPLRAENRFVGMIMVIDSVQTLTASEIARIETVGDAISAQVAARAAADDEIRAQRASLLRRALSDDAATRDTAVDELRDAGFGENRRLAVALVDISSARHSDAQIEMAIRSPDAGVDPGGMSRGIAAIRGRHAQTVRLFPTPVSAPQLREQAVRTHRTVTRALGDHARISVAVSGTVSSPAQIHLAHRQARVALRAAHRIRALNGIAIWDELGELAPLACIDDVPPGTRGEHALRLLAAGDTDGRLRETLSVYLDEAGSAPRAARALNLHRTSLYYRLRQIQEMTGLDLDSGSDRLVLHLQLRLDAFAAPQLSATKR